jgi:putative hydrolase
VSDEEPANDPFSAVPMFGEIFKAMRAQGPLNWDVARQFAGMTATEGLSEHNVDPAARVALQELAAIADLHVQTVTGLPTAVGGRSVAVEPVTPGTWAARTLDAYRPLFEALATSLASGATVPEPASDDPLMGMLGGLGRMMAPAMLGMTVGSMVGNLARRAFGQYDLPIPRPASSELLLVPATIDTFAHEWSLAVEEVRMWVCIQEIAAHAVLRIPSLGSALTDLVRLHVAGFRPNPDAIMEKLTSLDLGTGDPLAAVQQAFGDPEILLGAVRSPEQLALQPRVDALVAVVVGYVDHVVDQVAQHLLGTSGRIAEAVRRRRIETSPEDVFVERLLGLQLTRDQVQRGRRFVDGVIERGGPEALTRLHADESRLPTPNEVDAPGLWLARLELAD